MTRIARTGLILLAYIGIALILTWPVVSHLTTRVAGEGGDPWQSLWRLRTTQQSLQAQPLAQVLKYNFLGQGEPRLVNISAWPWLWLQVIAGEVAAYNIVWLLSYILAGVGMYALVRYVLQNWSTTPNRPIEIPSFLAGLFYMLAPFHVAQSLGHFGAMQIEWIPLALLAWLSWLKQPTWLRTLAVALLLIIQAWTEHHYALWLVIALAWIVYWAWSTGMATATKKYAVPSVALIILLVLGVVLPYVPTIKQAMAPDSTLQLGTDQTIRFSADLLASIIPPVTHSLWGSVFAPLYDSGLTGNSAEATQYLGLIPLLLIVFFYSTIPANQRKLWAGLAVIFLVLSWGPWLHILGKVTVIPLPYLLLQHWPVFDSIRTVARAGVVVAAAVSVLLGWVIHTQVTRKQIFALLGAIIVLEFISVPFPSQSAQLNPLYQKIKDLPGTTVIEVPAATNYVAASQALYAETIHGKQVLGNIALERAQTADELEYIQSLPGIRQFLYVRTTDIRQDRREFFGQDVAETLPDVLRWMKVSAIVLDTDSLSILQLKSLQQLADTLQVQSQQSGDIIMYDTSGISTKTDGIFLRRGSGWGNSVGFDKKTGHTLAQIQETVSVGLINVTDQVKPVVLSFTVKQPTNGRVSVMMDNQPVSTVSAQSQVITINLTLPPGEHAVQITNQQAEPMVIQDPQLIVQP